jgi:15-hydroxyprostaglandin dehydrogenase (NAD)
MRSRRMNKAQVVGLTRSLAYRLAKRGEAITVNTVCPALVLIGLIPADIAKKVPQEFITPSATVVRAVESFIADQSLTGQVVECSGQELFYHPTPTFSNPGTEWVMTGGVKRILDEHAKTNGK